MKLLNVGDQLMCHTTVEMKNVTYQSPLAAISGKIYRIINIDSYGYYITNEFGYIHLFEYKDYKDWFISVKELRNNKLEKLLNA